MIKSKTPILLFLLFGLLMVSCNVKPEPIKIGKDACAFCKMGVMDKRFGAELITKKGRIYKFDDLHCLIAFAKEATVKNSDVQGMYLVDYEEPHGFIDLQNAFLFKSDTFRSPMGSNTAAFLTEKQLKATTQSIQGGVVQLNSLMPTLK